MWYSSTISVWIGVLAIGIFALLLALLTLLILKCASKGKWKKTIFTLQKFSIFLGVLIFVVGIVAFIVKQEFHVWYPLCMIGLLLIIVMSTQLLIVSRLYSSVEKKDKKASTELKANSQNQSAIETKHNPNKSKEKKSKYEGIYSTTTDDDSSKQDESNS